MLEIINSLWIGLPLSLMERLSITSFLQNSHEYHLYRYDEIANVPDGTVLRDAAEILPASEIFYYRRGGGRGSVAAFADLFRYKLLLEKGGWWVDTDMVVCRRFISPNPLFLRGAKKKRHSSCHRRHQAAARTSGGRSLL